MPDIVIQVIGAVIGLYILGALVATQVPPAWQGPLGLSLISLVFIPLFIFAIPLLMIPEVLVIAVIAGGVLVAALSRSR